MAYQDEDDATLFMEDDIVAEMMFMSLEEAEAFFYHYAKNKGFGVRKEHLKKRAENVVCYRRFVCSREGFRQQKYSNDVPKNKNRPLTRCGCPVKFSVRLNVETGYWHVKEFVEEHNHELSTGEDVVFLRSHRNIGADMESDILSLEVVGLRKNQIMDVLEQKMGGFKNAGFTMKDLYNFVAKHKEIQGGWLFNWSEELRRYREMSKLGNEIFLKASKSEAETLKIMEILRQLSPRKNKKEDKQEDVLNDRKEKTDSPLFHVSDPNAVVGKGASKKRIKSWNEVKKTRCGFCQQVGHNIRTCPTIPKTSSNN